MSALQAFYESGRAVDFVIAVVLVEVLIFALLRRWAVVLGLIPGLCLLLALRAAVAGSGWQMVALWVAASLPAHMIDLSLRTRRSASGH